MTASFRAYVDESGDEGFKFRRASNEQASSDWFVLCAFLTRSTTDIATVKVVDSVRTEFNLPPRKHVHWKRLKHPEKVRYSQVVAGLRCRVISVCVHKPSLLEPEKFRERYRLYFYAVRYLLERVSWLARDSHHPERHGGDGTVDVCFSNRQGMSYEEMKEYLRKLRQKEETGQDVRIDFDHVPIDRIMTQTPGRTMGLQLADACAGAFFNALEKDNYGNTEHRYLDLISPVIYRNKGIARGYGFKIVPREASEMLREEPSLMWLREYQ